MYLKFLKKSLALLLSFCLLLQALMPLNALAISGPSQPEFSSFEPASTTNMVNEFTGDFTYNLPLFTIPGESGLSYPISLSYHSGISPEQDAGWVGLGWSLNPGAIIRNVRGFPDDISGGKVTYFTKKPKNWTASIGATVGVEAFSKDNDEAGLRVNAGGIDLTATLNYNNYRGFTTNKGIGISAFGIASLNFSKPSDGDHSFSANINPAGILGVISYSDGLPNNNFTHYMADQALNKTIQGYKMTLAGLMINTIYSGLGGKFNFYNVSTNIYPTNTIEFDEAKSYTGKIGVDVTPSGLPIGLEGNLSGTYSYQKSLESKERTIYGYMYLGNSTSDNDILDYSSERDRGFHKNDHYLPIPVAGYDVYTMTGEGNIGGFRLYNSKAGIFRPNAVTNKTELISIGAEVSVGMNVGAGADFSEGKHTVEVGKWEAGDITDYGFASYDDATDEAVFFKANGDMGGYMQFATDDNAVQASTDGEIPSSIYKKINNGENRTGRSAYIGFHTNSEMNQVSTYTTTYYYNSYCKDASIRSLIDRSVSETAKQIGEVSVTSSEGVNYLYGLPVYARNEGNIQYSLFNEAKEDMVESSNKHLLDMKSSFDPEKTRSKFGNYSATPYPTSYLLTSIHSPDFVDIDGDGPDEDDFGGYVKFGYDRLYGSDDKTSTTDTWYNWRAPYNGFIYQKNELSTEEDDAGSVSFGQKEIYYLSTIESKTHIAEFTVSYREDGLDSRQTTTSSDPAASEAYNSSTNVGAQGFNKLKKLDKIEIWTKDYNGNKLKRLQTMHFEYDYSLCEGTPDNLAKSIGDEGSGKLTLTKVWIEYYENDRSIVRPYEFTYAYKSSSDFPSYLKSKYSEIVSHGSAFNNDEQNPDYNSLNVDRWGFYAANEENRFANLIDWNDQTPDEDTFDPAAWHLKQIKLPTGGDILIQYEQKDYNYVQDKKAMVMVKLLDDGTSSNSKFYLDLAGMGMDGDDIETLLSLINKEIVANGRLYFKFLYDLNGDDPSIESCSSEYITGYAKVSDAGIDETGLYLDISSVEDTDYDYETITVGYTLPKQICNDYLQTNRSGSPSLTACSLDAALDADGKDAEEILEWLLNEIETYSSLGSASCGSLSYENSYIRIPFLGFKKGGGVRVKRILTYDNGLEDTQSDGEAYDDAALYGSEYGYVTTDEYGLTISSGVATNEPSEGREENALVQILENTKQNFIDRVIIAGIDRKQEEGPLGETMLNGSSIGYSKVTITNIHKGKTAPAFTIKEFFTEKDFPYSIDVTEIKQDQKNEQAQNLTNTKIEIGFDVTQGYAFHFYNMHGKPKSEKVCMWGDDNEEIVGSSKLYTYYDSDESIPFFDGENLTSNKIPQEVDIAIESKLMEDKYKNTIYEGDATIGYLWIPGTFIVVPIPFAVVLPITIEQESFLHSLVINKTINHIPVLKSVKIENNGIEYFTNNVGFDQNTGQAIVTTSTGDYEDGIGGYDGNYHTYSFQGAHQYTELGQKAENEGLSLNSGDNGVTIEKYYDSSVMEDMLIFTSDNPEVDMCEYLKLYPGDIVKINDGSRDQFYQVAEKQANKIIIDPYAKGGSASASSSPTEVDIEVIQSGRKNQLNTSVGNLSVWGEDWNYTASQSKDPLRKQLVEELNSNIIAKLADFKNYGSASFIINLSASGYENLEIKTGTSTIGECLYSDAAGLGYDVLSVTFGSYYNPATGSTDPNIGTLCLKSSGKNNCSCGIDPTYGEVFHSANANYDSPGYFAIDENSGNIIFVSTDMSCESQLIECLESCELNPELKEVENVVSASAITLSDEWNFNAPDYSSSIYSSIGNDYEKGNKGAWRKESDFVYYTSTTGFDGSSSHVYNYNSGLFDAYLFNWKDEDANSVTSWKKLSTLEKYSPYSQPLQDKNVLDIYSSTKYGYSKQLPYLVSQNATQDEVYFESFENEYSGLTSGCSTCYYDLDEMDGIKVAGHGWIDPNYAHSGSSSLRINSAGFSMSLITKKIPLESIQFTKHIKEQGLSFKVWIKQQPVSATSTTYWNLPSFFKMEFVGGSTTLTGNFEIIAKTGEWTLLECKFTNFSGFPSTIIGMEPRIVYTWKSGQGKINTWLDDIRVQPIDAQMNCFVYDKETRQVTSVLDDQHFSTNYQYNDEGKLIRVYKETEEGMKLIEETLYNLKTEFR